jgi:hypothetical protein
METFTSDTLCASVRTSVVLRGRYFAVGMLSAATHDCRCDASLKLRWPWEGQVTTIFEEMEKGIQQGIEREFEPRLAVRRKSRTFWSNVGKFLRNAVMAALVLVGFGLLYGVFAAIGPVSLETSLTIMFFVLIFAINYGFKTLYEKLGAIEGRLDRMQNLIDGHGKAIDYVFDTLRNKLDAIERRFENPFDEAP